MLIFVPAVTLVFLLFHWLSFGVATAIGAVTTFGTGIYSLRLLVRLVPVDRCPRLIRQVLSALRLLPNGIA
jgi:hypothetical protein